MEINLENKKNKNKNYRNTKNIVHPPLSLCNVKWKLSFSCISRKYRLVTVKPTLIMLSHSSYNFSIVIVFVAYMWLKFDSKMNWIPQNSENTSYNFSMFVSNSNISRSLLFVITGCHHICIHNYLQKNAHFEKTLISSMEIEDTCLSI